METGFFCAGFIALILNLVLDEEIEDEAVDITADTVDNEADRQEWKEIKGATGKVTSRDSSSGVTDSEEVKESAV